MKKKKRRSSTVLLILMFLAGLSLLLYPTISDYWNTFHASRAINSYADAVENLDEEEYETIWNEAIRYNRALASSPKHVMTDAEHEQYMNTLNFAGNGLMGHIEIPAIDVSLPVSHTTSDKVLQTGVGHIEWTSLPVGGSTAHCALSGHRGLPSAKLFTHLDKLVVGDVFILRVLDEVLTYEIDQISIVKPENVSNLEIVDGEDYCTLVTCTPYGINTHRLLVRGHRIETEEAATAIRIMADAIQVDELIVAPVIACPLLLLILLAMFIGTRVNRYRFGNESNRLEENDDTLEYMVEEKPRPKKHKADKANNDTDPDRPV